MPPFVISSLRGGMNDSDPPIALADDQCTLAQNVEFHRSTLGERRRGADAIDLTGSPFTDCDRIVWGHRHLPTSDPADAQCWLLGIDGSSAVLGYKDTTWHTVTMPDALIVDGVSEYQIDSVSLHGKLFIAYKSAVNRLHKWRTGSSLERVGMSAPSAAPTAVDTASGGSFTTTRYYRTRETLQSGGTTLLRSEPSATLTFSPNGSFTGAIVTKPATTNSDPAATHWELEASLDNSNFYLIATTVIGTGTATDTTAAGTGYGVAFSAVVWNVGDYLPPHSAKRLQADEDRLVVYGSHEDSALASSMSWTPVFNATGVGNDERITLDPVSIINLDGFEGGAITDESSAVAGELWTFKQGHVYKVIRTGIRTRAYEPHTMSKQRGALPGSVVEGVDEVGNPALYFIDPAAGPCRAVRGGIQTCGRDIWETFQTINLDATKAVSRGLYYPKTQQVLWCVATGDANVPDFGLTLQTNEQAINDDGEVRRGWSIRTGPSCGALTMFLFSENIDDDTDRSQSLVPFIGVEGGGLVWRLDTGDDDNGTEYAARITTKPYAPSSLQTEFEIKTAKLVGKAVDEARVVVSAIPNFGTTTTKIADALDFSPTGDEAHVTRFMDDLGIAGCEVVQIDFADTPTPGARWELARFSMTLSLGQGS